MRILATILFFALTGYLSAQTGNNPTAAPTPFNPFPTDPITGRLLPLPMFSGSVREATQKKDARVQKAEAKAIPDQAAAATEGHVAPVQGEPEEIDRQKDMERQKELEHFVSSERERLKGIPI